MRFFLPVLLLFFLLGLFGSLPERAHAQVGTPAELFRNEACLKDPNSEACICGYANQEAFYPARWTIDGDPTTPDDFLDHVLLFQDADGRWQGTVSSMPLGTDELLHDGDLVAVHDHRYNERCSFSFFRENLHRGWYLAVAVGSLLFSISLAWLGFVYMQETSSGGDMARVRGMFFRLVVGIMVLGLAFVAWETLNDFLLRDLQSFSANRSNFFFWSRVQ